MKYTVVNPYLSWKGTLPSRSTQSWIRIYRKRGRHSPDVHSRGRGHHPPEGPPSLYVFLNKLHEIKRKLALSKVTFYMPLKNTRLVVHQVLLAVEDK